MEPFPESLFCDFSLEITNLDYQQLTLSLSDLRRSFNLHIKLPEITCKIDSCLKSTIFSLVLRKQQLVGLGCIRKIYEEDIGNKPICSLLYPGTTTRAQESTVTGFLGPECEEHSSATTQSHYSPRIIAPQCMIGSYGVIKKKHGFQMDTPLLEEMEEDWLQ
ncbi:hypothetical protein STEG23_024477 [Scotinomys teguina]